MTAPASEDVGATPRPIEVIRFAVAVALTLLLGWAAKYLAVWAGAPDEPLLVGPSVLLQQARFAGVLATVAALAVAWRARTSRRSLRAAGCALLAVASTVVTVGLSIGAEALPLGGGTSGASAEPLRVFGVFLKELASLRGVVWVTGVASALYLTAEGWRTRVAGVALGAPLEATELMYLAVHVADRGLPTDAGALVLAELPSSSVKLLVVAAALPPVSAALDWLVDRGATSG